MIIISACLCGINCKYNGSNNYNEIFLKLVNEGRAIPVCPEQLGGLTTPRLPSEIVKTEYGIKVINKNSMDVTKNFKLGAERTLNIGKLVNAKVAILKSKSPSCGCGEIYSGDFNGKLIQGNGITTDLLIKNNIKVITDSEFLVTQKLY